ncbi:hypothetical protein E2C01_079469 [Portunus trituberculatus]|uniref:Uncharacterized protein n=1 Tax=Portunus trituberculatus TaxID=210409 RepID=A0A5B7ILL6_PORTR|nr:hypothetical protein [Portunus trituberculatus]
MRGVVFSFLHSPSVSFTSPSWGGGSLRGPSPRSYLSRTVPPLISRRVDNCPNPNSNSSPTRLLCHQPPQRYRHALILSLLLSRSGSYHMRLTRHHMSVFVPQEELNILS